MSKFFQFIYSFKKGKEKVMATFYDLYRNPPLQDESSEQKPLLHARVVSQGTVNTDTIARDIENATSFTKGDVKGVLLALQQQMEHYITEGYHVNLNGLGIFSAALECRPVKEKNEIRSASVKFSGLRFRSSAGLLRELRGKMSLVRNPNPVPATEVTEEEAFQRLETYLKSNPCISRREFSRLTGYSKGLAVKRLNNWISAGTLKRYGEGKGVVYYLNSK